jgi:tetratricopeptide (TPR) repeat protein
MAVFNSCRGAYTASSDPTDATGRRSLAEALVKRGVPGVLAMAERITDDVALTLTRLFYYNIKQGYPVDLSLNRARQGLMSAYGSHELYWALPVLYLHPEFDGYLTSAQETPGNPRTTGGDRPLTRQTSPIPPEIVAASSPSPFSTPSNSHSRDALDFSTIPPSRTGTMTVQSPFPEDDPELFDEGDLEGVYEDIMYDELDEDEAVSVVSELFREMVGETDPETDAVHRQNSQVQKAFDILEETITEELPPTVKSPSPTAQNWPLPATDAPLTQPPRQKTLSAAKSFGYKWRVAIGAAVAIAIAGAGFWTGQTRFSATTSGPGTVFPPTASIALESTLSPGEQANFSQLQTPEVGKLAFAYFNEGDAIAGQKALEELLQPQRSALNYAEAVLSGVPEPHKFDSSITFLWGRLAWQAVLSGNPKYSLDDVRRYWTRAVQQEPNNPTYYNALGFAYYADGNFTKAEDAWMESLKILEKMPLTGAKNSTNPESAPLESYDALTAYAGFSLILSRSASELPPGDRAEVLSKAIKLRKIVLNADPLSFQPDALATDWMWPESALEDWRSLLMTRE